MASLMQVNNNVPVAQRRIAFALASTLLCAPYAAKAEDTDACSTDNCAAEQANATTAPKLTRKERRQLRKEQKAQRDKENNERLDWYPLHLLSPAQLSATPPYCDGAYIDPDHVNSGKAYSRPKGFVIEGSGETEDERDKLDQGAMQSTKGTQLEANNLFFDNDSDIAVAKGNIEIREKGALILGSSATYNTKEGTGKIENAEMVSHLGHIRVRADKIERESETIIRITKGDYTQCAPSDNAWLMRAGEFELNQATNVGTARNARLRIKDVPVLWIPWISYPLNNERRSGLLFPNISTSSNTGGLDFTVPWYWNIRPNLDATIAPRHAGTRGWALETEVRYLNRFSEWRISGSIINDDTIDDNSGDPPANDSSSTIENPRWYLGVKERGTLGRGWSHRINYTQVSDNEYLNDLSGATSLEFKRSTNLEQSANLNKLGPQLEFRADAVRYQVIDDSVAPQYTRLPQLWLNFESFNQVHRPSWLIEAQATRFDISTDDRAAGSRVYLQPGVKLPLAAPWGHITPTIKIRSVTYALDESHLLEPNRPVEDANPSTTLPMVSIDSGLYFDRPTSWFGKRFTHTLEPRIYYLYSEFEDQSDQPLFDTGFTTFDYNQLFRESRFTGYDRIADANQMSLGLTTRLRQSSTGVDTVWASIGQTIYFADRKVTLDQQANSSNTDPLSPIAAEMGYQWTRNLRSYLTGIYDLTIQETVFDDNGAVVDPDDPTKFLQTDRSGFRQAGLQFRYFGDNGLILNLGYRYRVNETVVVTELPGGTTTSEPVQDYINQTDFSTIFPVTRHWAVIGRYNYDYTNNRALGTVAGFEYNSCCWKTRIVYQTGLSTSGDVENRINPETDRGIYFQFVMKGLGGADTGINSILRDSIVHYEDYDKRDEF